MSGVDETYRRYRYMAEGLSRLHRGARSKPLSEENLRVGLIEAGDTPKEAASKIEARIQDSRERLSALAILDMCAAFENECRKRIPTAVGEARRVLGQHYRVRTLESAKHALVKNADDFKGLDAIFRLVEGQLQGDAVGKLQHLRETRNIIAHGAASPERERMSLIEACDLLNAVLEILFPGQI